MQGHSIGKVVHHLNFVVALQDLLEAYSLAGNLSALLPHSHTEMILRETYFTYHSPRHFLNFFSNHGGEIANSKKSLCETFHSIQINTLGVELAKALTFCKIYLCSKKLKYKIKLILNLCFSLHKYFLQKVSSVISS